MSEGLPQLDDDPADVVETQVSTHLSDFRMRQLRPRVKWQDAQGAHALVLTGNTIVGSSEAAGIVIPDRQISRLHAEFELRTDGSWWVRDLGSKNGTFISEILVTAGRIPPGAKVRMGSVEFAFEASEESGAVEVSTEAQFGELVGKSLPMRQLFHYLSKVAPTDSSILIHGETGTGKELVARSIHDASLRKDGPFVVVDCAALPENLIESELFGHVKGSYTGATSTTSGAIEAANGGTLFFDEIGELPLSMQPKLLRVLERREVRRIGESTSRKVDVRFLSASHRDLRTMVNDGAFREDLYFRLAVLPAHVPPLRARPEDIPLLLTRFLASHPGVVLAPEVIDVLSKRPWLGNVRELRNFVERMAALGSQGAMSMSFTVPPPANVLAKAAAAAPNTSTGPVVGGEPASGDSAPPEAPPVPADAAAHREAILARPFKEFREEWINAGEREYIERLLARHDRNVSAAASEAGLDRTYLYRLIRKHLK